MNIVLIVMFVAALLLFLPGSSGLVLRILKGVLGTYDNAMFRARDISRDASQSPTRRAIFRLTYGLMLGAPLVLIILMLLLAEFGKFLAPYTRVILGKP